MLSCHGNSRKDLSIFLTVFVLTLCLIALRENYQSAPSAIMSDYTANISAQSRPPCKSVLLHGTGKDGREICPWSDIPKTLSYQLEALRNLRIAFVGDSRTRYIYHQLISSILEVEMGYGSQTDCQYYLRRKNLTLNFYWRPYPDQTILTDIQQFARVDKHSAPQYVVFGLGAWTALFNHQTANVSSIYADNLNKVGKNFTETLPDVPVIWVDTLPLVGQAANVTALLAQLQNVSVTVAQQNHMSLWSAARTEALNHMSSFFDGWHFKGPLLEKVVCQLAAALNGLNC